VLAREWCLVLSWILLTSRVICPPECVHKKCNKSGFSLGRLKRLRFVYTRAANILTEPETEAAGAYTKPTHTHTHTLTIKQRKTDPWQVDKVN